jgi:hypothetical protein
VTNYTERRTRGNPKRHAMAKMLLKLIVSGTIAKNEPAESRGCDSVSTLGKL